MSTCDTMMPLMAEKGGHGPNIVNITNAPPYEIKVYNSLGQRTHEYIPGDRRMLRGEQLFAVNEASAVQCKSTGLHFVASCSRHAR